MPSAFSASMHGVQRWSETAGREVVAARVEAFGGRCEICGQRRGHGASHRVAAGRGGTWAPSNLLWSCGSGTTLCHGDLEHHPDAAGAGGWHIRRSQRPATDVPAWLRIPYSPAGGWWLLSDDGLFLHHDPDLVPLPLDPAERPDLYVPDGLGGHRPAHLPYEGAAA